MTTPAARHPTILGWGATYLDLAKQLAAEASTASTDLQHEGQRAAAAIFLAGAALETLVHELVFLFGDSGELSAAQVCRIGRLDPPAEQYKRLAVEVCTNRSTAPPNFGVADFEKAHCVWRCRNYLIHYEPERQPLGIWPADLVPYAAKNWLPNLQDTEHWTSRLPTAAVADRLVCFVREFLLWFDSVFPLPSQVKSRYPFA